MDTDEKRVNSKNEADLLEDELLAGNYRYNVLQQRLRNGKQSIADLWAVFGNRTQYYILNIVMNAVFFAVFYNLNIHHSLLMNPSHYFVNTLPNGTTVTLKHSTTLSLNGDFKMPNGVIPMSDYKTISTVANGAGALLVIFTSQYSSTKMIHIFAVAAVGSILMGHAFSLHVFERISLTFLKMTTQATIILVLIRAFESGPKKYRVYAAGLSLYATTICLLAMNVFYQRSYGLAHADKAAIVCFTAIISIDCLLTPPQFIRSIVRNDLTTVQNILERYGCEKRLRGTNVESLVEDIIYSGHVPANIFDGFSHIFKIKPFRKKLLVLTLCLILTEYVRTYETYFVRYMIPLNPYESLMSSRFIQAYSSFFSVGLVFICGRRVLLILSLLFTCIGYLFVGAIPMHDISMCTNEMRPDDYDMKKALVFFFIIVCCESCTKFLILLMILEHIPAVYRTFVFPAVLVFHHVCFLTAHLLPVKSVHLTLQKNFAKPCFLGTFLSLILVLFFVDNSSFCAFSTAEIPVYQMPTKKIKRKKTKME